MKRGYQSGACLVRSVVIALAVLFFVGTLFVVGVGLLFYGLRGGSPSNFLTGVLMGMVILIVGGIAFTYVASKSLRYDPSTPCRVETAPSGP
jgi:hypothetical protein